MTSFEARRSVRQIYAMTVCGGLIGAVIFWRLHGLRAAAAFILGALCSLGNLSLFDWVSGAISPEGRSMKPWRAGAYALRFLLLVAVGYTVVKTLHVSPLAVALGLLTGTAAVMVWLVFEVFFLARGRISH